MAINIYAAFPPLPPATEGFVVVTRDVVAVWPAFNAAGDEIGSKIVLGNGIPHGTAPNTPTTEMLADAPGGVLDTLITEDPSLAFAPILLVDGRLVYVEEDAPFLIYPFNADGTIRIYLRAPVVGPNYVLSFVAFGPSAVAIAKRHGGTVPDRALRALRASAGQEWTPEAWREAFARRAPA